MNLVIKFISSFATLGSKESTVNRLDELASAAGKFNVLMQTSIKKNIANKSKEDSPKEKPKSVKDPNVSREPVEGTVRTDNAVITTKIIKDCTPEDATLISRVLFGLLQKSGNSDKYEAAKAHFDTCKRTVLSNFGTDNYSNLSQEERKVYAKMMIEAKAPFTYTTQSIHMKYGDLQTVYSKTRRVHGKSPFQEDFYEKHVDLAKERKAYIVTTNVARPNQGPSTPVKPESNTESSTS